jgi:hypothetical protein
VEPATVLHEAMAKPDHPWRIAATSAAGDGVKGKSGTCDALLACVKKKRKGTSIAWNVAREMRGCGASLTGAGEGNRTLVVSLGSFCSTIELHPHHPHSTRVLVCLKYFCCGRCEGKWGGLRHGCDGSTFSTARPAQINL